ncbi:MAG TPA: hypothetical protein VES67_08205 [Vicinamibacterales bacterium]|nr:hypothetical protein [Vicinamibacterales bacterium]
MSTLQVESDQFGFYATLVLAFLLCLVYLGIGLRVLREDSLGSKVAQFYGYSVCLVAVITLLVSTGSLAGALLEWGDPLHAGDVGGYPLRSLASFETYKMDILNPPYGGPQSTPPRYTPDDDTLRRMYEAARADRIQGVNARVRRTVVTNSVLILFGIALFRIHWRWQKRMTIQN